MLRELSIAVSCALAAACAALPAAPVRYEPASASDARASEPVLYGRDGKPVGEASPDRGASTGRDAQADGGRYTLLELYQRALDQRDGLEREVEALRAELDKLRGELTTTRADLASAREDDVARDAERERLIAENLELASRLATAQIRRMQAEKALLELQLASARVVASTSAATTTATPPAKVEGHP